MTYKSALGANGESIACEYLVGKGYKILERNYRKPWGELDIVAVSPGKTLVFVEVKTVAGIDPDYTAEEQLTQSKLTKLQRTASLYANKYFERHPDDAGWQIDLIAINIVGDEHSVKHYENI
ncbi:MAG: YraN family protein [Candidatus Colwellbacteria bacterium]|nr:YraN family protein [Candidatus Colwellbacteria bacterium]